MIVKNTNGYMIFQFESIQEFEFLFKRLPIPNLVPLKDKPLTFIRQAQAEIPFLIKGRPLNRYSTPVVSNADVISGFKENDLTYCIELDGVVPVTTVIQKVNMVKNQAGLYMSNFLLQPYARVGFDGRARNYEAVYDPKSGMFVYTYVEFQLL
jgi:hypothetical protein